jgi:MFS transporter, YQGE family, putative transporter
MLRKIIIRFRKEVDHYRVLTPEVRHLLISYYLYLIAYPLFAVFTNAYLWRLEKDLTLLVVYNLLYCAGLPLGFYANGLLLRKFHTLKLYAAGAVLEGLAGVLIVMFSTSSLIVLAFYGLLAGLGAGLYWGNKNYLSLILTKGTNRLYYNSLETAGDTVINMVVPALAGGFIVFGEPLGLYDTHFAYKCLMLIALILVILAGYVVQSSKIKDIDREALFVDKPSPRWTLVRLYNVLSNVVIGAEFVIPSVLVLVLVGKEGTLGVISSATSILSAILIYVLGRKGKIKNVWKIVCFASLIYLGGASLLAWNYSSIFVLIYMVVSTIGWVFRWPNAYAVVMETMDKEDRSKGQYAYICDNEFTFNLGRSAGLFLILLVAGLSQDTALRFIPLVVGFTSLISIYPLTLLTQQISASKT